MYSSKFKYFCTLLILVLIFSTITNAQRNFLRGTWSGKLNLGATELRVVFNITREKGKFKATMDSPDQGAKDIPVDEIIIEGKNATFKVNIAKAMFVGEFNDDNTQITGKWIQGSNTIPLTLTKTEKKIVLKRPQEPKPPYPYLVEDVTFRNNKDNIKFAGTLTLPKGNGPFRTAILITGSGPQNRDEELLGHKPFWIIADYLTRNGVAVLRYDDRGTGKSEGDFPKATSLDFAVDAMAAVEYLKTRKEIDVNKIGLIGHSEGGLIAPIVATKNNSVAYIVLLAGTGLPGSEIITLQSELISRANGETEENIKLGKDFNIKVFNEINSSTDDVDLKEKLDKMFNDFYDGLSEKEQKKLGSKETFTAKEINLLSPWFRYFLKYDPRPTLEKVKCPVLAINGSKDLQVPSKENLREIENALKKGGNKNYQIIELSELNHLFQTAVTGLPMEYSKITETFSHTALKTIIDWIKSEVK
ncbi:MAG: alpha/beta hydrolase [Ignavibacteriales bacterium CG_4_9_14_3_um_filter_30_11]|nr:MAG: alpha/beta hydrolase [Ignavibacteriales bacterium CG_4_9_14_3_um_filter_30_11]